MPASQQIAASVWGLAVGLGFLVIIYMTVRSGWFRKGGSDTIPERDPLPEAAPPVHEYPEGLSEAHGRVPAVLKIVIVGYVVFLVAYVGLFLRRM
jgi:hypothetical protein